MSSVDVEILDGPHWTEDAEGWGHHAYRLRLTYGGHSMETPWKQGAALTEDPSASDVLECLALEAVGFDNADGFEDWAYEYGYDPDSRKAFALYEEVGAQRLALARLLGADYDDVTREAMSR